MKILGSILDLIKEFFRKIKNFFKKKKEEYIEKKKKEEKQQKSKKYNRLEIIGKSTVGFIIGIFQNLFHKKEDKKSREIDIEKELKSINRNILNIENQIEHETTPIILKMYKKQVNKSIEKVKNMRNLKNREDSKKLKNETEMLLNIKDKISACENKLEDLKLEATMNLKDVGVEINTKKEDLKIDKKESKIDKKELKIEKKENKKIKKNKKRKIDNNKNIVNKMVKKVIPVLNKTKEVPTKIKKGILVSSLGLVSVVKKVLPIKEKVNPKKMKKQEDNKLKNKIKEFNNEINKTYNDIAKIKNSIYDDSKELELLILKDKIIDLKKEYLELSKNLNFVDLKQYKEISSIDPNHLSYHDKAIDNLIDYLDLSIKELKDKNNKSREEKNKPQKVVKKFEVDIVELKLITDSISKDTKITKKEIEKIKNKINMCSPKNKKKTIISSITNFFKNSINIGISLIPFGIFRNKLLATLTSGIILNNRIRYMRSVVNNEDTVLIDYEYILKNISDKKDCLEKTNYVLSSTINEVSNLKIEIETNYDITNMEVLNLLKELEEMNVDLIKENKKIEKSLEDINEINNNKIKKLKYN